MISHRGRLVCASARAGEGFYSRLNLHGHDNPPGAPIDTEVATAMSANLRVVAKWFFDVYMGTVTAVSVPQTPAVSVSVSVPEPMPIPPLEGPEIGSGAPNPEAFRSGYERNRDHLGRPRASVVERRVHLDGLRTDFVFYTQRFVGDQPDRRFLLVWHESLPTAYCVRHGMAHKYITRGLMEKLGAPTEEEHAVTSTTGVRAAVQSFKLGEPLWRHRALYYHLEGPRTGKAYFTTGAIHARYQELGREQSALGLPISNEEPTPDGAESRFERGRIIWREAGGVIEVRLEPAEGRR